MPGKRQELFSERVFAGSRTYFFDVKETAKGTKYLVISESKRTSQGSHEHTRVMVFEEHLEAFREGLEKTLKFILKKENAKTHSIEQIRHKYPRAYEKWAEQEDLRLKEGYAQGKTTSELAKIFQRKPGAIRARLKRLGALEKE